MIKMFFVIPLIKHENVYLISVKAGRQGFKKIMKQKWTIIIFRKVTQPFLYICDIFNNGKKTE